MDALETFELLSAAKTWSTVPAFGQLSSKARRGALKKRVKICQTLYWYGFLQEQTGLSTAWAIQRLLLPLSFSKCRNIKTHSTNIFTKYRDGNHKPNKTTLAKIEAVCPGSSSVLLDLLWTLLIREDFTRNRSQRLLKRLPPRLCSSLFKKDRHGRPQRNLQWEINPSEADENDLSLLCAYIILAREALDAGRQTEADKWGYKVFDAFLHLSPRLLRLRVVQPLFQLLDDLIFVHTDLALSNSEPINLLNKLCRTAYVLRFDADYFLALSWAEDLAKMTSRMLYQNLSNAQLYKQKRNV